MSFDDLYKKETKEERICNGDTYNVKVDETWIRSNRYLTLEEWSELNRRKKMSEITQIEQIRDIKLNVTKEDVLRVFLKEKSPYMCTPVEFLKNCIIHLIMLIPALCLLIFCIINGTIPEILITIFIAVMLFIVVEICCYETFDIEILTDTYYKWKRYQFICKFVQQEFVTTEKSVKELLNLPMIYESCRTLYQLRTIANNMMNVVTRDGAVRFYDKINNEIYLMYDINQKKYSKVLQFNRVIKY